MEERDVQIRGYKVRLPLDLYVVASANPEDYTNRGRIITPLKDRFGSQVRTHYPKRLDHEIAIMDAERTAFPSGGIRVTSPEYMKQIVAELTHLARQSSDISQRSGVSVRVSIANYENLLSSALKRAIRLGEKDAVARVSDLGAVVASTTGKIELDADDLLAAMADDVLADGDPWRALQRLMHQGVPPGENQRRRGLQDVLKELRKRRQDRLDRYDVGSSLDDIKKKLDDVIKTEREGIDRRV